MFYVKTMLENFIKQFKNFDFTHVKPCNANKITKIDLK